MPRSALSDRLFSLFRFTALIEGVTTLVLFLVAMPLKYLAGDPSWVPLSGLIHDWAFIAYILLMVAALWGRGWSGLDWLRTTLASFIPFGTFLNDPFLRARKARESV